MDNGQGQDVSVRVTREGSVAAPGGGNGAAAKPAPAHPKPSRWGRSEFAQVDALGRPVVKGADGPVPPRPEGPVLVELPDGRTLTMERPKRPINAIVFQWLGERSTNMGLVALYRALFYVTEINGAPLPPVGSEQDLAARVNQLGDDGMDAAVAAYMNYWPTVQVSEVPKSKTTSATPTSPTSSPAS